MLIGYAGVSTPAQNLDRQIAALRSAGCETIYREKASGKAVKGRPQLEKAIDALGTDDVLVVAEWDRATRSMMDGIQIMQRVAARGSAITVLDKPHLDLTTPIGRGFLAFLSALAEDERARVVSRAADGRREARARGVKFGSKPKLSDHQKAKALSAWSPAMAAGKSRATWASHTPPSRDFRGQCYGMRVKCNRGDARVYVEKN